MENSEDPFADIWISNWERQCEIELENEPDLDQAVLSERDLSTQKLWYLFQNSATSVAQLFKGKIFGQIQIEIIISSISYLNFRSQSTTSTLAPFSNCSWDYYIIIQR